MLDFWRSLAFFWLLSFGISGFTISGLVYNPWAFQQKTFSQTVSYTVDVAGVYVWDQFFMFSAFFSYIKIKKYFETKESIDAEDFYRGY